MATIYKVRFFFILNYVLNCNLHIIHPMCLFCISAFFAHFFKKFIPLDCKVYSILIKPFLHESNMQKKAHEVYL